MLTEEIRTRLVQAMKDRDDRTKAILRVALGEIQTAETSTGRALDDAGVEKVLRKLVKSNEETIAASGRDEQKEVLRHELEVLASFLPQTLGPEEIVEALAEVRDAILGAKGDGPATGIAMKHLKASGAPVAGQDVAAAVRAIRA